jgi:hypothetical protein
VKLGTKVRYDARRTLWREHLPSGNRRWSSQSYGSTQTPREGVIVGVRTLANGDVEYGGWDATTTFHPTEHFKAYLVAFDMRKNPVYVLPEDLEVLDS